jgi:hypothetical protein
MARLVPLGAQDEPFRGADAAGVLHPACVVATAAPGRSLGRLLVGLAAGEIAMPDFVEAILD